MDSQLPDSLQRAAEEVRAHLVTVRGGGLFLSSADGRRLIAWLEAGRAVPELIHAIELAAVAREKKPTKLPFSLGYAARFLAREPAPPLAAEGALAPLALVLEERAGARSDPAPLRALAAELRALPEADAEGLFRGATGAIRAFLTREWDALGAEGQAARLEAARAELAELYGALLEDMDEDTARARVEERTRARLRAEYPELSSTSLMAYLEGGQR
ncbi:MAG: hypothetical protein JXX28_14525 [Deltaproteobacteria bacterium]|nr:hypothetical protein [Deltaproteobacteria bacterium]